MRMEDLNTGKSQAKVHALGPDYPTPVLNAHDIWVSKQTDVDIRRGVV
jgi:hypothetical protein